MSWLPRTALAGAAGGRCWAAASARSSARRWRAASARAARRRAARRRCVAPCDALRGAPADATGCAAPQARGAARHRLLGRAGLPRRARAAPARARASTQRARSACSSSCRPSRPRPTACCCSTPATRSTGATRSAADHFGLDPRARPPPARHQPRARAGLRGLPAGAAASTSR
ncbi:MAG: hypothetical protein MZW92_25925 [Comamonadaceae bacterium]|nr:hypothetical protein [Comamonadaceae bacterium]